MDDKPVNRSACLDNMIKELEMADTDQLSSCLRNVFLHLDPDEFIKKLDERISMHDAEIEKVCQHHYQGFVDSFQKLMHIKEETTKLRNEIVNNNKVTVTACSKLIAKTEEAIAARQLKNNILLTIETLENFMPVFDAYRRLKEKMNAKDYYPALEILEELKIKLAPFAKRFKWCQTITNEVNRFRNIIMAESFNELKNFLEQVATKADKVGIAAFAKTALDLNLDWKIVMPVDTRKKSRAPLPPNPFTGEVDRLVEDDQPWTKCLEELTVADLIDVLPVYRSININLVLGSNEEFSMHYQVEKRKQLSVIMDTSQNVASFLEGFKRFLRRTAGFFVIEDYLLSTTDNFIDVRFYNELCERATQKLVSVVRDSINSCQKPYDMLDIKLIMTLFCQTMKDYGFPISSSLDALNELKDQYFEALLNAWTERFRTLIAEDNYHSVCVNSEQELVELQQKYPFLSYIEKSTNKTFPRQLKFSMLVPRLFSDICDFATQCYKFSEGLDSSEKEMDEIIKKPLNSLLTPNLHMCLLELLNDRNRTLTQLVQICINACQMEEFSGSLEKCIAENLKLKSSEFRLQGVSVFKDFREDSQTRIYAQLNISVDQFLELADYDWMLPESTGTPSSYMIDLLKFLRTTFASFQNIPTELFQTALTSTCRYIAKRLFDQILDPENKMISYGAMDQLDLDLMQCERFVTEMSLNKNDSDVILMSFAELRQLIDLTRGKDWSAYFVDFGKKSSKYSQVSPKNALIIAEKLRESCKKGRGILANFRTKQTGKDEKKLLDTVVQELHNLVEPN